MSDRAGTLEVKALDDDDGPELFRTVERQAASALELARGDSFQLVMLGLVTISLARVYIDAGLRQGPLSRMMPPLIVKINKVVDSQPLTTEEIFDALQDSQEVQALVRRLAALVARASLEHRLQLVLTAHRWYLDNEAHSLREELTASAE